MKPARQHSRPRGGGSRQSRRCLFERLEQEEQRLKKHDGVGWTSNSQCLCVNLFLGKPQICGKQHTTHLPLFLIIYSPFANSSGFFGAHILFVSITAHIVATVKKLYEILHISVWSTVFNPEISIHIQNILKNNLYKYKIQIIVHA